MIKRFTQFGLLFTLSLFAKISVSAEQTATKTLNSPNLGASALFETILGLMLVLGLIVFLAWLLRRTGRFQMTSKGEMKIIASMALGTRERAVLLQVGEQQLLLGVTSQQIQTLHVLEKNIVSESSEPMSSSFASKLHKVMQQDKGEK
jgi:flagellar protein FliO/FliZ